MVLLISKKLESELKDAAHESAHQFTHDAMYQIAQKYYEKMPLAKELWILVVAKADLFTGNLNVALKAADRENLHKINVPIQGAQLWYTNQTTGEIRLEWILPFSKKGTKDRIEVTKGNKIIEKSFDQAEKWLGRDLLTGRVKNYRHRRPFGV